MSKKFWFKPIKWDKKVINLALEVGFDAILVPADLVSQVRELSKIKIISDSKDADLVIGKDCFEVKINSHDDEKKVIKHQGKVPVIIYNSDWTIIPLENLISQTTNLIQHVHSQKEAKLALETMERGADGVLLETEDLGEIKKMTDLIRASQNENLSLVEAEIESVEELGIGDRVIVDTASILAPGQGMLVGDSSSAMFLVYNENVENPYVNARPFRVNAGGAHAYIRMPGDKTSYLGDLENGKKALAVDIKGNTEQVIIGRIKIEKRPMLMVRAKVGKRKVSLVMQNAETIRLTKPDGDYISVTRLKKGDKVLSFLQEEGVGRHFGQKLKESITEK